MTTTLLAVDDSKTMRKVLEITFAGEDYRTVLAESAADAMAKLRSESPAVALVDANLGGESGYDLCLQIKQASPKTVVLILSSKQVPFDRAKGATAGADDHVDKPFDTQQLLDRVGAAVRKGPTAVAPGAAPAPAAGSSPVAAVAPQPGMRAPQPRPQPGPTTHTRPGVAPAGPRPQQPQPGQQHRPQPAGPRPAQPMRQPGPAQRPGSSPQAAGRPVARVATQQGRPAPAPQPHPAPAAQPIRKPTPSPMAAAPAVAAATADMAGKLQGLGLTQDQINGVMALSREVVEQVVWEVVPVLAETIIKEEIKRLTAE